MKEQNSKFDMKMFQKTMNIFRQSYLNIKTDKKIFGSIYKSH